MDLQDTIKEYVMQLKNVEPTLREVAKANEPLVLHPRLNVRMLQALWLPMESVLQKDLALFSDFVAV